MRKYTYNLINTMKAKDLSAENFLDNNDLNITGTCFIINVTSGGLFTVHASPTCWEFAFQKDADWKITTVKPYNCEEYSVRTCVWMVFKAYKMGLKYSFGDIDPTRGRLHKSHKEKFDKMSL